MLPTDAIGKIARFYPNTTSVVLCLPLPNAVRMVGAVIGAKSLPPTQRGGIPDMELTVRGKSGRIATVSFVENYCTLFETWHEAAEDTDQPQPVSRAA